jgi:flagellar operon protein (TIGR03826 family)
MADLRNCSRCGRLFGYAGRPICSYCVEEEEDEFKKVKEYLYDNPGSTVFEVADATNVEVEKIMRFLKEERLQVSSENPNMLLECEKCSRPINMGRFCQNCKNELHTSMRKEFGLDKPAAPAEDDYKLKTQGKDQMYTATRRR